MMRLLSESESQGSVLLILSSGTYLGTYLPSTAYLMQNQTIVILCPPYNVYIQNKPTLEPRLVRHVVTWSVHR